MRTWGSQGTWRFLSAELLLYPQIPHSFIHDIESAYFVLLSIGLEKMPTENQKQFASNILYDIMDARRYESGGGMQKYFFMTLPTALRNFKIPSNPKFGSLMRTLHGKLSSRYQQLENLQKNKENKENKENDEDNEDDEDDEDNEDNEDDEMTARNLAALQLPSFVTKEQYAECAFKHNTFINIIIKALKSRRWPTGDFAVDQHILRPNSDVALAASSSKRSRLQYESENNGSSLKPGSHSFKRLNSSSPA